MTISINVIYNFLVSLILVSGTFLLGMIFKNKIYPPEKKQEPPHETNPAGGQPENTPVSDEPKSGTGTSAQDEKIHQQILNGARDEAKTFLDQTAQKAYEMISGVKQTNEHLEENIDRILSQIAAADIRLLKETTDNFDAEYKQTLANIETQMQKIASDMIIKTKEEYDQKLEEFMNELLKGGTETKSLVDKKTAELLSIVEADIADYKKEKLALVDDEVRSIIKKVYKDVLQQSIPENIHHELILESLERAKKDEIFTS